VAGLTTFFPIILVAFVERVNNEDKRSTCTFDVPKRLDYQPGDLFSKLASCNREVLAKKLQQSSAKIRVVLRKEVGKRADDSAGVATRVMLARYEEAAG
jgi:hypothetical protein